MGCAYFYRMNLGERIKKRREEKRMTKSKLATLIGTSYVQITKYENNETKPSFDVLKGLADVLYEGSIDRLIVDIEQEKSKYSDLIMSRLQTSLPLLDVKEQESLWVIIDNLTNFKSVKMAIGKKAATD